MTTPKTILLLTWFIVLSTTLAWCQLQRNNNQQQYNPSEQEQQEFKKHSQEEHWEWHTYMNEEELNQYATWSLSEQEIADITHMRQEEKLARDVYRTLWELYPTNQFKNIPLSEQNHTDAMELILERYSLEDPIVDETIVGTYKDSKFTTLFDELTLQWKKSLTDALIVWATIEDINIAKLWEVIANTDNMDIKAVYTSVLWQSHNHMRAFIKWLKMQWWTYTPKYISQELFDSIVAGN
jgi:hypothetical protein